MVSHCCQSGPECGASCMVATPLNFTWLPLHTEKSTPGSTNSTPCGRVWGASLAKEHQGSLWDERQGTSRTGTGSLPEMGAGTRFVPRDTFSVCPELWVTLLPFASARERLAGTKLCVCSQTVNQLAIQTNSPGLCQPCRVTLVPTPLKGIPLQCPDPVTGRSHKSPSLLSPLKQC